MATGLYAWGRDGFANGVFNWPSDDIRFLFLDSAFYTVNLTSDKFVSDIAGSAIVARSGSTLTGKTTAAGVCDAIDFTVASVSGAQFEAIGFYKYNVLDSAARLIAYVDNYVGLPCTPSGGPITVSFPNDANKIFKL